MSVIVFLLSHRNKASITQIAPSQKVKSLTLPPKPGVRTAFHIDFDSLAAVSDRQHLKAVHTAPHDVSPLIPFLLACLDLLSVETTLY